MIMKKHGYKRYLGYSIGIKNKHRVRKLSGDIKNIEKPYRCHYNK